MHNVDTTLMHSEPGIEKYYMQRGKQLELQHSRGTAAFSRKIRRIQRY